MIVLVIKDREYPVLKDVSLLPECDVTSGTVTVDETVLTVRTDEVIQPGQWCRLVDDLGNLWARRYITRADREQDRVRITAMSALYPLNQAAKLGAVMWTDKPFPEAVAEVMGGIDYDLAPALEAVTLSGYCPEQKPLERLQHMCFAVGAYVRTEFTYAVEIRPLGDTERTVPVSETFWKPSIARDDWVTEVAVTAWAFEAAPEELPAGAETVEDAQGNKYIATKVRHALSNPDAPQGVIPKVVEYDKVKLVNSGNVDGILERVGNVNFARTEVSADVLNDGRYKPGQRLAVYVDDHTIVEGWCASASFRFGMRCRSTLKLVGCEEKKAATLTVNYRWNTVEGQGRIVAKRQYILPAAEPYRIPAPYIDTWIGGHHYVFYPVVDWIEGYLPTRGAQVTADVLPALDGYQQKLYAYAIDGAAVVADGRGLRLL